MNHAGSKALAIVLLLSAAPLDRAAQAEPLSVQDVEESGRLRLSRGYPAEEVNALVERINKAGERSLPVEPLANKVKEGLAKGVEPKRIDPVLQQMVTHFDTAHELLKEAGSKGWIEAGAGSRTRAIEMLADGLSRGVTTEDVRELSRTLQDGKQKVSQEALAAGAKSLGLMREGRVPSKEASALVGDGLRQGFRASELVDLGREVKRRSPDIQQGRLTIQSLRDQVSRGQRPDRIFRDERGGSDGPGGGERLDRGDRSGGRDGGDRGRDDRGGRRGGRD